MTLLFLFGVISFFVSESIAEKYIGLFFFILSFLWAILIFLKVLPLSPTRHSLILLPYITILVSEGLGFITNQISYLKNKINSHMIISSILSFLIMLFFFVYFNGIVRERQDPFNESDLYNLFKRYKIDTVISYGATSNLGLMFHNKDISWKYIDSGNNEEPLKIYKDSLPFKRIVLISHRNKLNELMFNKIKLNVNNSSKPYFIINNNFSDFKILFSKEINSNVELDFSTKTKNGTNGLYLYILENKFIS
jgi:phosphate/sulfate permease